MEIHTRSESRQHSVRRIVAAIVCFVVTFVASPGPRAMPVQARAAVEPFFAPAQPAGSIAVKLYPTETVAPGVPVLVTFGVPFTRGSLTAERLATVRVLRDGVEVPAFVEQLTPWRHARDARLDGTSVRVARVQITYSFSASFPTSETITVEWGGRARARSVSTLVDPRSAWHLVTSGSFAAEDGVFEPDVYTVLPGDHLGQGALRAMRMLALDASVPQEREDPEAIGAVGHWPGYVELDRASKNNFFTVLNEDDVRVAEENRCPYKIDYEPWLYDRAAAMFVLAMRGGSFKALRESVRAAEFYRQQLWPAGTEPESAVGVFKLKVPDPFGYVGGNGAMYSYAECLAYSHWLTGDDLARDAVPLVASAHEANDEPTRWDPSLSEWTERHTAFRLLANTVAYELFGGDVYRDRLLAQATDFIWHQDGAGGQLPAGRVDGALYHYGEQHHDGEEDALVASTWMLALTTDAMVRAYAVSEEPAIAEFVRRAAVWQTMVLKQDAAHIYDTYEDVLRYPAYLVRVDGAPDRRDGGEGDVIEHSLDVAVAIAWGAYFAELLGAPDPRLARAAGDLYASYDEGVDYWIRPAAPPLGLSAYRVNPWRKFAWEHRLSGSFSWVMGQLDVSGGGDDCTAVAAGSARSLPLPAHAGTFSVAVDVTPQAHPIDATIGLALGPQASVKGMACAIRFAGDGAIQTLDRRRFRPGPGSYEAGVRYRVRFEVNLGTHRYSAYVSRDGGAEQAVGTNLALRRTYRSAASLDMLVVTAEQGLLEVCALP
jgi:hypothetical protein